MLSNDIFFFYVCLISFYYHLIQRDFLNRYCVGQRGRKSRREREWLSTRDCLDTRGDCSGLLVNPSLIVFPQNFEKLQSREKIEAGGIFSSR